MPTYVVVETAKKARVKRHGARRKDILAELKREAAKANRIFLATDPDREGEAIAWHIEDELELDEARTFRITFNEITRTAVQNALGQRRQDQHGPRPRPGSPPHPRPRRRLSAQQSARQKGDPRPRAPAGCSRWPCAWSSIANARSRRSRRRNTGRSPPCWPRPAPWRIAAKPLSIVRPSPRKPKADAEEGDEAAEGKARRNRDAAAETPDGTFLAELAEWDGAKFEAGERASCRRHRQRAGHGRLRGDASRAEGPRREGAAAVHHQHAAAAGEHPAALHRQADHADRPEAVRRRRARQRRLGGPHHLHAYRQHARLGRRAEGGARAHRARPTATRYLPEKPNFFASGKSAQEAHEAIRPTDLAYTPERVARLGCSGDQLRLYTLIYNRFVASQMTPAIFAVTNVEVEATPEPGPWPVQGPGQDPQVRRLPQGAGARRQAGRRDAAAAEPRSRSSTGST